MITLNLLMDSFRETVSMKAVNERLFMYIFATLFFYLLFFYRAFMFRFAASVEKYVYVKTIVLKS